MTRGMIAWEFTPKVRDALVGAILKGKRPRVIEMTPQGPRVRFDAFRIDGVDRRIEMLFKGAVVASHPLPIDCRLDEIIEVRLSPLDGGYLGVKIE